jgi:hypothetical protein
MTPKVRGAGEIRYNQTRSRLRCIRISRGFFDGENAPALCDGVVLPSLEFIDPGGAAAAGAEAFMP